MKTRHCILGSAATAILAFTMVGCQTGGPVPVELTIRENLLVCNKADHTVGIIDLTAGRQVSAVDVKGQTGHELAVSPDGRRAFVPIFGDSGVGKPGTDGARVQVVDIAKRRVVNSIDFKKGVRPHCAVFGPKNGLLYVTAELDESVAVIDPVSCQVVGRIPTSQPESHMMVITRDGKQAYVSNVGPGTISILNLAENKLAGIIPLGTTCQRLALSADGKLLFTADQNQPRLAVISTESNALGRWISLPGIGYGMAVTPNGLYLLVALPKLNQVGLVDLQEMELVRVLDVPASPQEVLMRSDGAQAFVSCDVSGQVAVIDVKYWEIERLINAGRGVDGMAWRN